MRLDDRTADREPDADAVRFRRVEAVKDARYLLRLEAAPRILYGKDNSRAALDRGPDGQLPRPVGVPDHGFERVGDQVRDDLLQLDGIGHHQEGRGSEFGPRDDTLLVDGAARQVEHVLYDVVDIQQKLVRFLLVEQRPDPGNHLPGAVAVGNDAPCRLARVVEHRRLLAEGAKARAAIRRNRGKRLIDLVRDRGGELGDRGEAQRASQLRLGIAQRLLGALALGQIDDRANEFDASGWAAPEFADGLHVFGR